MRRARRDPSNRSRSFAGDRGTCRPDPGPRRTAPSVLRGCGPPPGSIGSVLAAIALATPARRARRRRPVSASRPRRRRRRAIRRPRSNGDLRRRSRASAAPVSSGPGQAASPPSSRAHARPVASSIHHSRAAYGSADVVVGDHRVLGRRSPPPRASVRTARARAADAARARRRTARRRGHDPRRRTPHRGCGRRRTPLGLGGASRSPTTGRRRPRPRSRCDASHVASTRRSVIPRA